MNNFTFYSPTLFSFGDGEEKNTGALVGRVGGTRGVWTPFWRGPPHSPPPPDGLLPPPPVQLGRRSPVL